MPPMERTRREPGRRLAALAAGCWLVVAVGCTSMPPRELPPLTPEPTTHMLPGKFVWIDLITQDVAAAQSFYGELFGWTFREGRRYSEILDGDRAIVAFDGLVEPAIPRKDLGAAE